LNLRASLRIRIRICIKIPDALAATH
jgi:hypothetical protein